FLSNNDQVLLPELANDVPLPDIQQTIDFLTEIGDTENAKGYQKVLEQRKAQASAVAQTPTLQQQVSNAFNQVRSLENKLSKAVTHRQKLKEHIDT
ncbi:unnamed protein product, partial [Prorocentrum cordatum]